MQLQVDIHRKLKINKNDKKKLKGKLVVTTKIKLLHNDQLWNDGCNYVNKKMINFMVPKI